MKSLKLLLLSSMILFSVNIFSQVDNMPKSNSKSDANSFYDWIESMPDVPFFGSRTRFEAHWAGLEFAYKNWHYNGSSLNKDIYDLKGGWMFRWNIFDIEIPFNRWSGLFTGVGYESSIFYLKDPNGFLNSMYPTDINSNPNFIYSIPFEDAKMVVRYINLPLMYEWHNRSRRFVVQAGFIFGWNCYTRLKNEYDDSKWDIYSKFKDNDNFTTNAFKADFSIRIGTRNLQLVADYALVPLFKTSKSEEVRPFNIGINLAF